MNARFCPRVPFQLIFKAIVSVKIEDIMRRVTLPNPLPPPCDNLETFEKINIISRLIQTKLSYHHHPLHLIFIYAPIFF